MATDVGVVTCWGLLETAGFERPFVTDEATAKALGVWLLVLADVDDDRLLALVTAWLRSPEVKYGRWPMPGALLHALGSPEDLDDSDQAWAEVLHLLRWKGMAEAPVGPEELEALRLSLRRQYVAARERGDDDRCHRLERAGRQLPPADLERTEALFAGIGACGGWRSLGMADDAQLVTHRAAFRSCYRGHRLRRRLSTTERQVAALLDDHFAPSGVRRLAGGS